MGAIMARTFSRPEEAAAIRRVYSIHPKKWTAPMRSLYLAVSLAATPMVLAAQKAPPSTPPLQVGAVAPDFAMRGATRFGVLAKPIHLSDFKGKTVVLAFFFKARTSG
jgi:hypothetical protein